MSVFILHYTYHHALLFQDSILHSDLYLKVDLVAQMKNYTMDQSLWIKKLAVPANQKIACKIGKKKLKVVWVWFGLHLGTCRYSPVPVHELCCMVAGPDIL